MKSSKEVYKHNSGADKRGINTHVGLRVHCRGRIDLENAVTSANRWLAERFRKVLYS